MCYKGNKSVYGFLSGNIKHMVIVVNILYSKSKSDYSTPNKDWLNKDKLMCMPMDAVIDGSFRVVPAEVGFGALSSIHTYEY